MLIFLGPNKAIQLFSEQLDVRFSGYNWDFEPMGFFFNLIVVIVYTKKLNK